MHDKANGFKRPRLSPGRYHRSRISLLLSWPSKVLGLSRYLQLPYILCVTFKQGENGNSNYRYFLNRHVLALKYHVYRRMCRIKKVFTSSV